MDACIIDSQITHASEEAEAGSIAIGLAAALAIHNDTDHLLERIYPHLPDSKVKSVIYTLGSLVNAKHISAATALQVLAPRLTLGKQCQQLCIASSSSITTMMQY